MTASTTLNAEDFEHAAAEWLAHDVGGARTSWDAIQWRRAGACVVAAVHFCVEAGMDVTLWNVLDILVPDSEEEFNADMMM